VSVSQVTDVRAFYDASADAYAAIMDSDIESPLYTDVLARLAERIAGLPGALVDTACGPGHLLRLYHDQFNPTRALIGIDLSPGMVSLALKKLGPAATVQQGDMRDLPHLETGIAASVISFFALHHVDADDAARALGEWHRILGERGQLVLGTWEGTGRIDYGDAADIAALRYTVSEVRDLVAHAGFVVDRATVASVDEMPMDAVYLEATRATQ
jgi:ubiquinone/menaquinone biosynthesis C-methylase UbiE